MKPTSIADSTVGRTVDQRDAFFGIAVAPTPRTVGDMTHDSPPDPDPDMSPDLDSGGSPLGPQTPASASTSMASDSALTGQSPTPTGRPVAATIAIAVAAVLVLLIVVGLLARLFFLD